MEDINVKVLDEVNKGTTMGMDAIHFVSSKVGDDRFKKVLDVEYGKYKEIANRVDNSFNRFKVSFLKVKRSPARVVILRAGVSFFI